MKTHQHTRAGGVRGGGEGRAALLRAHPLRPGPEPHRQAGMLHVNGDLR